MLLDRTKEILDLDLIFWQEWQKHRDCLYRCCLNLMGGNRDEAEDVLSEAMLKARDFLAKSAVPFQSIKGWLLTLTHNLCQDILKKQKRLSFEVEDQEWVAKGETPALAA